MKSKVIMGIVLTALLIGMLTLAFNIQSIKAGGTIYIMADGSVKPDTAPISSVDNVTYTFTGNINDYIVVERSNIIIKGNGYTLTGNGTGNGITVENPVYNVTIRNTKISNFFYGIFLNLTSNCTISRNNITNTVIGICLLNSDYNTITNNDCSLNDWGLSLGDLSWHNTIANNYVHSNNVWGIFLGGYTPSRNCSFNIIANNDISNNTYGIELDTSFKNTVIQNNLIENDCGIFLWSFWNTIYHNNFLNNTNQVGVGSTWLTTFDDGYPSGGNYWSNYNGTDVKSGPNQDQLGRDGIGDIKYVISDANNTDHYPLMHLWTPTETIVVGHPVTITSNTTISGIQATENTLSFTASGPTGETGYILVIFPMVNTSRIRVYINDIEITPPPFPVINTNGTHYFIYFEFTLSKHTITIQFGPTPVGGIYIPVNKLELLAPWIGLTSTIILAIAASAVFFKYRKKR